VSAIDTTTLTENARYHTGAEICPMRLAVTDRVWFGYSCQADWKAGIGSIDVASASPTVTLNQHGNVTYYSAPLLATAPKSNLLLAGVTGLSPASLYSYSQDASGALTLGAQSAWGIIGSDLEDLALTPDGAKVYVATKSPYYIKVYSGKELTPSGLLQPMPYPVAAAVTSKGDRLAAAGVGYNEPDVFLFKTADGTLLAPPTETSSWLQPRGLAWSPNGKRLFGVVGGGSGQDPRLLVLAQ
jgi:DNA-binding beta-propeller fold protein YncE